MCATWKSHLRAQSTFIGAFIRITVSLKTLSGFSAVGCTAVSCALTFRGACSPSSTRMNGALLIKRWQEITTLLFFPVLAVIMQPHDGMTLQ